MCESGPGEITPGILPSALRAALLRCGVQISSRRICRTVSSHSHEHRINKKTSAREVFLFMARPARFELTTPAFGGQYSIQLSYGRI